MGEFGGKGKGKGIEMKRNKKKMLRKKVGGDVQVPLGSITNPPG